VKKENKSTFIIAEVGSVHDGSFGNACKLIELATNCGASAIKFQTHISDAETLPNAPMPSYFKGEPRYEYFQRTGFTKQQWSKLKQHCDERHIEFMSSPFSIEAVELLEEIGMKRFKIPSGEVTNIPMLEEIAKLKKPVLLSSGMSNWQELDQAVKTIQQYHNDITVMQCSSAYPCTDEKVGLNILNEMKQRWSLPIGFSDHTLDNHAIFSSVTLGATVVEKHFTFSKYMYGSDAQHSAEPTQFKELVKGVRAIETMLSSNVDKNDTSDYKEMKNIFEKSIIAKQTITSGTILTEKMLCYKKPGTGIPASRYKSIIGKKTNRVISANEMILESHFT
jgi:N-acetylneuraminate synthase